MAVPILQTLVGLTFVLLGIALAGRPLTSKAEQWLCRSIFIALGLVLFSLSWIEHRNEQKREMAFHEKVLLSNTNQPVAQAVPEKEPGTVESNKLDLQQKYQSLLGELATNSSLAPDVRERIIITTAKLDRDAHALQQMPDDDALNAAQVARAKIMPLFDYGIKTLGAMTKEAAVLKGDKSALDYQGLPPDLDPDAKTGKRSRRSVAEVRFEKNADLNFEIYFAEAVLPQYEASLGIMCKGGVLILRSSGDSIGTKLQAFSGESSEHDPASGDDAKTSIYDALEKLMASESDALAVKK